MEVNNYIREDEKRTLMALQVIFCMCEGDGRLFSVDSKAMDIKSEIAREIGYRIISAYLEPHGNS